MPGPAPPSGSRAAVTISKFVGVATLGLLTGSSFSLFNHIPQSLLAFPSPQAATRAFTTLRISTSRTHAILAGTSLTSLLLAYGCSPRGWRHPYLLWTILALILTEGFEKDGSEGWWTWAKLRAGVIKGEEFELIEREQEEGLAGDVNGEVVRGRMDDWSRGMAWRTMGWGIAWTIATIGLWGDGFGS